VPAHVAETYDANTGLYILIGIGSFICLVALVFLICDLGKSKQNAVKKAVIATNAAPTDLSKKPARLNISNTFVSSRDASQIEPSISSLRRQSKLDDIF